MSATDDSSTPAPAEASVSAQVLQLLSTCTDSHPCSLARLAKQLGLAQSQLRRVLSELQELGVVEARHEARRTLLSLTAQGRRVLNDAASSVAIPGLSQVWRERITAHPSLTKSCSELDWVIEEAAVALLYNGHAYVVMMLTPVDLDDFALGYSLAEGIVEQATELRVVDTVRHSDGFAIHLAIPQARFDDLMQRSARSSAGSASCGLCGTRELSEAVWMPTPAMPRTRVAALEQGELSRRFEQLHALQLLNARSGAAHAAATVLPNGELLLREDIGRHTAVDKLIGSLARSGVQLELLLLTSRVSFEIVRKAARVGVHTIAAISAPSALALRSARAAGIAIWAFVREEQGNRYL